jgi:hypothetical protein
LIGFAEEEKGEGWLISKIRKKKRNQTKPSKKGGKGATTTITGYFSFMNRNPNKIV